MNIKLIKKAGLVFLTVIIILSSLYLTYFYIYNIWMFILTLMATLAIIYFTFFYYSNLLYKPAVLFDEDSNISIGLYPKNKQAVFVFTNDDISSITNINEIKTVTSLLNKYSVKGTFFVIPYYKSKYSIAENKSLVHYLKKIEKEGFEIAQHGLTHFIPKHSTRINKSQEFRNLPFSEQKRRILKGKNILKFAGFDIQGFRAPTFTANADTFRIIDESEFLYSSDIRIRPFIFMTNKRYAESLYYPFHIKDSNFLEFVANGDYFSLNPLDSFGKTIGDYESIKRRFERYYKNHGVFVLLTHINSLCNKRSLKIFTDFLEYQKKKDLWRTNLHELTKWWLARENLYAESSIENSTLTINIESNSEYTLRNLAVTIKQDVIESRIKKYKIYLDTSEIYQQEKKLIKEGSFSDLAGRTIFIDI